MNFARLIVFALITQLLVAPATAGMLVLCIGSDGHMAVESANANLCCREWETARQAAPDDLVVNLEPAAGPCCDDVDLFVESATLTVAAQKVVPASALPCCGPVPASPLGAAYAGTSPPSTESPVAVSLRTVVLRT